MPFIENPAGSGLFEYVADATDIPVDVTAADLATYVSANDADADFVAECFAQAHALVSNAIGGAVVPATVVGRAYLEAGSELFHRRSAPNGISQFASQDGAAIRVARDPLVGVYPLINSYLGPAIA